MSSFLPRTLWFHTSNLKQERVTQDEIPGLADCLVILGEPGMGKSSLLAAIKAATGAPTCTARQLINRHDPHSLLGDSRLLVIDALDEVAASKEGDAVDSVLQRLGALGYPRFILSCRVADWRAATALEAIREQYDAPPLELHLEPLDRDQQRILLVRETHDAARAGALLAHFEKYQLDFLGNPQTLKLIAALPADQALPTTSSKLFELATDQLRLEHKDGKREVPTGRALDAAGAAFAALLLTGSSKIVMTASSNVGDGELTFCEVEALAGADLQRIVDTRLVSGASGNFTYAHRRIGEYLAARWLAQRADTSSKRNRLLAMLRSEGHVPANLRGLHAWLSLDPKLAPEVITTDPMGVIDYSDGDVLSPAQARLLLDSIERLSRDNPRLIGWDDYRASSLLSSPLQDEVRSIIADRARAFGLRKLLLDQLRGEHLAQVMRDALLARLRDPDEYFAIRERAGQVLIAAGGIDWKVEIEAIRCQADRMSTRLAFELMDDVGVEAFDDVQIVEAVLAYDGLSLCPIPRSPAGQTVARFWKLARDIPFERLDGLLDLLTDYAKALLPRHAGIEEHNLLDLHYELVLRRLERGVPELSRLWSWLEHFDDQSTYRRDRIEQLANWFEANDEVRRALQHLRLLGERDPKKFRMLAFELRDVSPGLSISPADAMALLDRLDPTDRRDERWREVLWFVPTAGDEGKPMRDAAKAFAAHRSDLLEWIDCLEVPPEQEWERKRRIDTRKRDVERVAAHTEHRRGFASNLDAVQRGDFNYIVNLARAYLSQFRDIGGDRPAHERIADWVGSKVADAAHKGFESFLQISPPRPNAARIAIGHAKGTRWHAADVIVAALAERLRTHAVPFEGVPSERLMAGLFEIWRTRIDDHAKIKGLQNSLEDELAARGEIECALRLYIEPQLKKNAAHVSHIYTVMRSKAFGGMLSLRLAEDWLRRFPNLPAEPENEMVDALLSAGLIGSFPLLINDRLAQPLDEERRRNWDSVQLIVDFNAGRQRLRQQAIEPALLWHLRARGGSRRRDDRSSAGLSPAQIEWIVTTFRSLFTNYDHPSGASSGDTNPWDATDYLRGLVARLGNDVSDDAVATLERLRDAPTDGYTDAFKIYAAEQRQARAERHYAPPTLAAIRGVIEAGPPTTAADLQAVLLEALYQVQLRLNGDDVDSYRGFFRDDRKTQRKEEDCSNELIKLLRLVEPTLNYHPEVHGADDKRVDIVAQVAPETIVPIEVKGQWHPDLWTAADAQLDHLYVNDWRAERGIYLVLWFGKGVKFQPPPKEISKPTTPEALAIALKATSKSAAKGRVAIVVLDLTRPRPL